MDITTEITVEKRVLNPADDCNDSERVYMRNDSLTMIECEVKRRPTFYDYDLMLDEAYKGISFELGLLAAKGFRAHLYIPGPLLERSKFANDRYDLFATPKKLGINYLEKSERDHVIMERFRRFGLYHIPFSSLRTAFSYLSIKLNRLVIFSQDQTFNSFETIELIRSLSGSDDFVRLKAPLDWHSITNRLCSSGAVIGIEFGSFDDSYRSLSLIGLRAKWQQMAPQALA